MIAALDHTHDPAVTSWVASANDPAADFPLQNLPFDRFRCTGDSDWRRGIAIGDQVLDLQRAGIVQSNDMNQFMALGRAASRAARHALFDGLRTEAARRGAWQSHLVPQSAVTMGIPCRIGDYTDFYTSRALGVLFRVRLSPATPGRRIRRRGPRRSSAPPAPCGAPAPST